MRSSRCKGAEIIFAPTWGTTFPDRDGCAEGETVFRVRARDNGVYMVPSVYDGSSMVIDPLGRILASNKGREGVFWHEVDLSQREPLPWVGHWRSIAPHDRMPGTYGELGKEPQRDRDERPLTRLPRLGRKDLSAIVLHQGDTGGTHPPVKVRSRTCGRRPGPARPSHA